MIRAISFFILLLCSFSVHAENVRTIIQFNSNISEGAYSLSDITTIAQENGIGALIVTDRDLQKWEYGFWPLRNIFKKTVQDKSIIQYGAKNYLNDIVKVGKEHPSVTMIPGVESAPFYLWQGNPFGRDFTMSHWHKHIITVGLNTPEDINSLPVIGNTKALYTKFDFFKLWPILVFLLIPFNKGKRKVIGIIIFVGGLCLVNNYPFRSMRFTQYQPLYKESAYQEYIDYANSRGALTFWAHPQAQDISKIGHISFVTLKHPELLAATQNYTGFAVFYEGYDDIADAGGLWDRLLLEYLRHQRNMPLFAIGAMGLDKERDLVERIKDMQTVVFVDRNSKDNIIDSLKHGKMYVVKGQDSLNFDLTDFSVTDGITTAVSGQTLVAKNRVFLNIKCSFKNKAAKLRLKIIRNGEILDERALGLPVEFSFQDEMPVKRPVFYRIEITGEGLHVISNPIFVMPDRTGAK